MLGSGFSNAPVSRLVLFSLLTASILASITDTKHYIWIETVPHLHPYKQYWRLLTWQLAYTSSTELLFAAMTIYHMRLIERLWGPRKFASYLICIYITTSLLSPLLLSLVLRPLSLGTINYLPAGPTAVTFSLLAQYHAAIPHVYKYRVQSSAASYSRGSSSANAGAANDASGLVFSDKSLTYLLAAQSALAQIPGSLLCALLGWVMGLAWRFEVLPASVVRWRVPGWVVGERHARGLGSVSVGVREGGVQELRRRLDERGVAGLSSGSATVGNGIGEEGARRR